VRRTIRDANRASEVIKRLRAMFNKKAPTMEVVDLNEAAREVVALSAGELQRARASLQLNLSDGLPMVLGDRIQLQQVILNLLLNAADAMVGVEDRPRTLLIQTENSDADSVRLFARDSGVGIDQKATEKLFDAFYTTKAHGMGVGLAISRSIIESHKGQLWAVANDGPGATFGFSIPRAPGVLKG
jgi:signal transduction histidine kinase